MMNSWEERQRNTLLDGRRALERTSESLARSERTALETEAIGVEVVSNLGTQRETLQRARNRLEDIDQGLSQTQSILNTMTRRVFTNKLLLIDLNDLKMTEEFSQNVLLKVVAQLCQMVGYERIMTSSLHILADILRIFICHLGQSAQHYAEHCGRSCISLNDLSLAFFDCDIRASDLFEFLKIVSPLPQCITIPKYPVSKNRTSPSHENTQCFQESRCNNEAPRETLKIKISLSKIKAATKSKRVKSMKNKKKKRNKSQRTEK